MKIFILIVVIIAILFLFGYFLRNLESFVLDIKHGINRKHLRVVSGSLDYVELFENNPLTTIFFDIQSYQESVQSLQKKDYDFGLFDQTSIQDIPHPLVVLNRSQMTEVAVDLEDSTNSYPNLVLITHKKNMHKLLDLGIINSSKV
ncbi:MAG: hypothetical protein Q4C49_12015 [Bacillota bacterium]|nr:hypothetical protein [Bacillota bacterium]